LGSRGGGDARTEELEGGEGYHAGEGLQEQGRERDDLAPHGAGHRERDQRSHRRLHSHYARQDHPLQRHWNPARLEHSRNFSRERGREGKQSRERLGLSDLRVRTAGERNERGVGSAYILLPPSKNRQKKTEDRFVDILSERSSYSNFL